MILSLPMRKLIQTLANSDPWLLTLLVGLLVVAGFCRLFMRAASPVPADKTVITLCKPGFKRDREEMKEFRAAFHAKHPDIHLKVIQSALARKPDTMIAAGVPPDLIFVGGNLLDYYLQADALLDLTPIIARDPQLRRDLYGDARGAAPDFFPQLLRPLERDGRLFVLPVTYMPFFVFYSKDLFDRYHVPYPDEAWDWQGLRERALALTRDANGRRPDQPGYDRSRVVSYGFHYAKWQHGIENFIRQAGGRLVDETGTRIVANDPRTVEAIQFLYDLKYVDGVCPPGVRPQKQDYSLKKGTLGMYLYPVFRIPTLRAEAPNLDWDIAPLPRGPGGRRASMVDINSWGISSRCRNPEAAFKLLKFMVSAEGLAITNRHQIFLPTRRSALNRARDAGGDLPPRSTWVLTHDLDHGYAELPFATKQYYQDVYAVVNEHFERLLALHNPPYTPAEMCEQLTREANSVLTRDRAVPGAARFGWVALAFALAATVFLVARLVGRRRGGLSKLQRYEERWGYALISPWLIGFLLFSAIPILISVVMSFAQWQTLSHFTHGEFVGFENYRVALSGEDPKFWTSVWVTLRYALFAVPAGLIVGLALAILLNQRVRGIALFRTLFYVPAVLPAVASAVLFWHLFDVNHGWVNRVLGALLPSGGLSDLLASFGESFPVAWLESALFTPYVFVLLSLWTVGGGMIIYLAGLQNIPTQLYEAAEVDGAGRWKQFRHVTLPMLSPIIFFNLVMGIIGSFQVFNVAFVMFDGQSSPGDSALFYGLHLFQEAFYHYRLGYASALAWILFLVILALTALVFKSSPLWVHYEAARGKKA